MKKKVRNEMKYFSHFREEKWKTEQVRKWNETISIRIQIEGVFICGRMILFLLRLQHIDRLFSLVDFGIPVNKTHSHAIINVINKKKKKEREREETKNNIHTHIGSHLALSSCLYHKSCHHKIEHWSGDKVNSYNIEKWPPTMSNLWNPNMGQREWIAIYTLLE